MRSPRDSESRPTTNRPSAKATDKQHRTAPYPVDAFGICDIFAEERRALAACKARRALELESLGLTPPESCDIDALRWDMGRRHVGRPT